MEEVQTNQTENNNNSSEGDGWKEYILPVSILIAAVMISGALVYNAGNSGNLAANSADTVEEESSGPAASKVQPVTESDHIRGDADAPIKIVEFSDLECPYCESFHSTMKQVVREYRGEVAWVYRHFPLTNIHPNAKGAAEASECVAELGNNDKFWQFVDSIFENQSSLSSSMLVSTAGEVGVNRAEFNECMESDRHVDKVDSDMSNAVDSGGRGTPYSVIITDSNEYVPINGAQPYSSIAQTLDKLLE